MVNHMFNVFNQIVSKGEYNLESLQERFKDFPDLLLTKTNIDRLSTMELPKRQTEFAAAYDLSLPYSTTIFPGEKKKLFFGWELSLTDIDEDPTDFIQGVVLPRSSLAKKKGLLLVDRFNLLYDNNLVTATFENFTDKPVLIEEGERIAQICFVQSFNIKKKHNFKCMETVSSADLVLNPSESEEFSFVALDDYVLDPGKVTILPTKIKCNLDSSEVLFLRTTFEKDPFHNIVLANGIGVVDADYYNNDSNEGEIGFLLLNRSYVPCTIKKGTIIGKGWISNYLTLKGDVAGGKRTGGFGSTE